MSRSPPRIGYVPYSASLTHPGDLRRFVAYARARNLPFEVARPDGRYDVVVLSELSDISVWSEYRGGKVVTISLIPIWQCLVPILSNCCAAWSGMRTGGTDGYA